MNRYRLRAYFFLLITVLIWGVAGPVIKYTLGGLSPILFLTYRLAVSSLVALPFLFLVKHEKPKSFTDLFLILFYAFLSSTVGLGLLFWGLKKTTVLEMSIMDLVGPLLIVFAGSMFLKEHVTKKEKVGLSIALIGTTLTIIEPVLTDGLEFGQASGNFFIFLSLIAGAIAAVVLKELLRKGYSPLGLANISFLVGFSSFAPFAVRELGFAGIFKTISTLPPSYHLGVLFMALLSGNLAYFLYNFAYKTIEISEGALFSYLIPITSALIAVFFMDEVLSFPFIIGAIIVSVGVMIAEIKKTRYNSSSRTKKGR
jgi:drug/metabolite transporter (DMT)-like permease